MDALTMKNKFNTIGIIGGMGSFATAALFQKILQYSGVRTDAEFPRIFIDNNSFIPDRTAALVAGGTSPVPAIVESGRGLVSAGAQVLGMPCNTAHAFLPHITPQLPARFVNMVTETVGAIRTDYPRGTRVGILCTTGTRTSRLYDRALADVGMRMVNVDDAAQEIVMQAIYGADGIKSGNTEMPRQLLLQATESLMAQGTKVIILACTEIPLALTQSDASVPLVDTTEILAKALLREARILV